jgi:hypothetical protein
MSRKKYVGSEKKIAFGDRLREYLAYKNRNYNEISAIIGISGGFLSDVLSGRSSLSQESLISLITNFSDLNPEWLLIGVGEMLKQPPQATNNRVRASNEGRNTDVPDLLQAAKRVLESDNSVAFDALERNVRYFDHAVAVEKRLKDVEERLRALEEKAGDCDSPDCADAAG